LGPSLSKTSIVFNPLGAYCCFFGATIFTFSRMVHIYVARHGQDQDNANGILNGHRDEPLTEIGKGQAKTVAEKIKACGLEFDAIYSSPLQRAKYTAEIISETLDKTKQVKVLDDLMERDFGVMTGVPTREIANLCSPGVLQTDQICYFLSPQGAETFPDLMNRANRILSQVVSLHPAGSVLLVTHGDFGKMLYAAFYELSWQDVLRQFHFGNSEVLLLSKESSADQAHVFEIQQYNP
jgi:probable phosphoglycerate mutase